MPYKDREKQREYNVAQHRRRYASDPDYYKRDIKARQRENREFIRSQRTKCLRCQETHPACLDFHHRDPETKLFNLGSRKAETVSRAKLVAEIAKCDVVCSNCHRKEHASVV